jgi:hypothetical protein
VRPQAAQQPLHRHGLDGQQARLQQHREEKQQRGQEKLQRRQEKQQRQQRPTGTPAGCAVGKPDAEAPSADAGARPLLSARNAGAPQPATAAAAAPTPASSDPQVDEGAPQPATAAAAANIPAGSNQQGNAGAPQPATVAAAVPTHAGSNLQSAAKDGDSPAGQGSSVNPIAAPAAHCTPHRGTAARAHPASTGLGTTAACNHPVAVLPAAEASAMPAAVAATEAGPGPAAGSTRALAAQQLGASSGGGTRGNVVGAFRTFLPAKRPASPVLAAGKKPATRVSAAPAAQHGSPNNIIM